MQEFFIGDFVKLKNSNEVAYFIVVDYADFSYNQNGVTVSSFDYDIMQVFPTVRTPQSEAVMESELEIAIGLETKEYDYILKFITKERYRNNWLEEANFFTEIKKNSQAIAEYEEKLKRGENPKKPTKPQDVIYYNKLETIDECLDTLNDLSRLHKLFGDEAYLTLREVVKERIEKLS
ncbi:hypothetical protein Q7A53_06285 [Halobacillus rhizosphaerae]|uniref:hypothetical protein n=1 Tax=Halobacillus rhizosphaerae TaxID=3064889 RepID=UPI00398AD7FC